jgi:hypothetical protein
LTLVRAGSAAYWQTMDNSGHERSPTHHRNYRLPAYNLLTLGVGDCCSGVRVSPPSCREPCELLPTRRQVTRGRASPSGRAGSRRRPRLPGTQERIQPWSSQPTPKSLPPAGLHEPDVTLTFHIALLRLSRCCGSSTPRSARHRGCTGRQSCDARLGQWPRAWANGRLAGALWLGALVHTG